MTYRLLPILLLLLFVGASAGEFATPFANHARGEYENELRLAAKKYTTALQKAQVMAFKKKDLAEANLLQDELDRLKRGDGPQPAAPSFVGRTFQSPNDPTVVSFKPDGTFGSDKDGADPAQRWFALADDRALVYAPSGWTTLFVFTDNFSTVQAHPIGQSPDRATWTAPLQPPTDPAANANKRWPLGHR